MVKIPKVILRIPKKSFETHGNELETSNTMCSSLGKFLILTTIVKILDVALNFIRANKKYAPTRYSRFIIEYLPNIIQIIKAIAYAFKESIIKEIETGLTDSQDRKCFQC